MSISVVLVISARANVRTTSASFVSDTVVIGEQYAS